MPEVFRFHGFSFFFYSREHMKDAVNKLFSQVVTLLVEMGQITLEESSTSTARR